MRGSPPGETTTYPTMMYGPYISLATYLLLLSPVKIVPHNAPILKHFTGTDVCLKFGLDFIASLDTQTLGSWCRRFTYRPHRLYRHRRADMLTMPLRGRIFLKSDGAKL